MTSFRTLIAIAFTTMLIQSLHPSRADTLPLRNGFYQITARLELPHVERWAIDQTTTICLSGLRGGGEIPIPVLSANNPFANCSAANIAVDGAILQYEIVCPGRAAAKAHAIYKLSADKFDGRVAMTMAAKNMTMTEVLRARRIGDCDTAVPGLAARL